MAPDLGKDSGALSAALCLLCHDTRSRLSPLLVSLMVGALLTGITTWMSGLLGGAEFLGHPLDLGVSFIFISALRQIFKFQTCVFCVFNGGMCESGAAITSFFYLDRSLFVNQRSQLHVRRRGLDKPRYSYGFI